MSHQHTSSEPTPADSGAPPAPRPEPPRLSRWVPVIALAIALIAVALAAWSLLRPTPAPPAPSYTGQQVADAKARACAAYDTVRSAVSLQTHANPGGDPVAVEAVAANARLSMVAGGSYLPARLDPATPRPLAEAVRSFADNLQDIAMNTLAGVGNDDPAQAARLRDGEAGSARIADLCK